AAGQKCDRLDARALRRETVPRRVPEHRRPAAACLLEAGDDQVRLGLGCLDVRGGGPAVHDVANLQEIYVMVHLALLGRAREYDSVSSSFELTHQRLRA